MSSTDKKIQANDSMRTVANSQRSGKPITTTSQGKPTYTPPKQDVTKK